MQRIIELTPKSTKWMFIGIGLMNTGIGLNLLFQSESWIHWTSILSFLLIIGGPILFAYGIILFFPLFEYAPKVQLDDEKILIKNDIHKKEVNIYWKDIKGITYKILELDFSLKNNRTVTFDLPTTPKKSIEIKRLIREYSEQNNIEIIGG